MNAESRDSPSAPSARMRALVRELNRHARLYYQEDRPEISDAEYDRLWRELVELEQTHPGDVLPDSPTRRIGPPPAAGFAQVAHRVPMLSLDNAMDEAEMRAWSERVARLLDREEPVPLVGEPKLDGASVELVYERGHLAVGATRNTFALGACGLIVINPPHMLHAAAEALLPYFTQHLAQGRGAASQIRWLGTERAA